MLNLIENNNIIVGKLLEFYDLITNTKNGFEKIGGRVDVYIFGDDRICYTPHIHLVDNDLTIEVSLMDWSIVHIKGNVGNKEEIRINSIMKMFKKWINNENKKHNLPNFYILFSIADSILTSSGRGTRLINFIDKVDTISDELAFYLKNESNK